MDLINILKFTIGVLFLGIGAYQDVKSREITSIVWFFMGITASLFLFLQYTSNVFYSIILVVIFFSWFLDMGTFEKYMDIIFLISLFMVLIFSREEAVFFIDGALMLAYKYLYHYGAFGGKADVRAMMAITLLNPIYPELFTNFYANRSLVSIVFPYSLEVLFYATLFNAVIFMIYLFLKNIKNGANFNWRFIFTHIYKDNGWVRYQTPFVFSILLGFIFSYIFDLFFVFNLS